MLSLIQELTLAVIFGGMVTFQILFAPLVFTKLEMTIARPFIRAFFPFYYLYFGILSIVLLVVALVNNNLYLSMWSAAIATGFIIARQALMPLANKATDEGKPKVFKRYHMATVLINTLQLIAIVWIYYAQI